MASTAYTNTRRAELRAAGKCINGPLVGNVGHGGAEHGPVVRGGKCQRCIDTHRDLHPYEPSLRPDVLVTMPSFRVLKQLERVDALAVGDIDLDVPKRNISWTLQYQLAQGRVEHVSRKSWRITERGRQWLREMAERAALAA